MNSWVDYKYLSNHDMIHIYNFTYQINPRNALAIYHFKVAIQLAQIWNLSCYRWCSASAGPAITIFTFSFQNPLYFLFFIFCLPEHSSFSSFQFREGPFLMSLLEQLLFVSFLLSLIKLLLTKQTYTNY